MILWGNEPEETPLLRQPGGRFDEFTTCLRIPSGDKSKTRLATTSSVSAWSSWTSARTAKADVRWAVAELRQAGKTACGDARFGGICVLLRMQGTQHRFTEMESAT